MRILFAHLLAWSLSLPQQPAVTFPSMNWNQVWETFSVILILNELLQLEMFVLRRTHSWIRTCITSSDRRTLSLWISFWVSRFCSWIQLYFSPVDDELPHMYFSEFKSSYQNSHCLIWFYTSSIWSIWCSFMFHIFDFIDQAQDIAISCAELMVCLIRCRSHKWIE